MINFFRLGLVWICLALPQWVMGVPVRAGFEEATKSNSNIAIRVLLDRHHREATVTSNLDHLYLSYGAGWQQLPKSAVVRMVPNRLGDSLVVGTAVIPSRQVYLRGGAHPRDRLIFKGQSYRGALKIVMEKNELVFTDILPLEDYLEGILASEMSPSWELEALRAQAVASRSYALYMQKHPKNALYDLERSTQDQVYAGAGTDSPKVLQAIQSTAGEYLAHENEPIKAYFHSRCGGETESAEAVWQRPGRLSRTRVACPFCRKHPFAWKSVFDVRSVARLFALPLTNLSSFRLSSLSRTPSGRISSLRIDADGRHKTLSSDQFRALLGYNRIKSARFDWNVQRTPQGEEVRFEGVGLGHGVGMCQWGARYLAQQGQDYRRILAYYYPGEKLVDGHPTPPPTGLP